MPHCNVLQHMTQHSVAHCSTLQHTTTRYNTLQQSVAAARQDARLSFLGASLLSFGVATQHCNTLQHTATHCNTLQHTTTHCNTLQHFITHYSTLQHTTTYYNRALQHKMPDAPSQMCLSSVVMCLSLFCCNVFVSLLL